MRRAVERFNESEQPRTVAGLIRSLGEPRVGRAPGPSRQHGAGHGRLGALLVPVGGRRRRRRAEAVREVAKGSELSELAEATGPGTPRWPRTAASPARLRRQARRSALGLSA